MSHLRSAREPSQSFNTEILVTNNWEILCFVVEDSDCVSAPQAKRRKGVFAEKTPILENYFGKVATAHRCGKCKSVFQGLTNFQKHQRRCSKLFCVTCKKTFYVKENFDRHFTNCPPKRYPCSKCHKTFSRKSDVEKHEKKHADVKPTFSCPSCGCICLTQKQLELHAQGSHATSWFDVLLQQWQQIWSVLDVEIFSFKFCSTVPFITDHRNIFCCLLWKLQHLSEIAVKSVCAK